MLWEDCRRKGRWAALRMVCCSICKLPICLGVWAERKRCGRHLTTPSMLRGQSAQHVPLLRWLWHCLGRVIMPVWAFCRCENSTMSMKEPWKQCPKCYPSTTELVWAILFALALWCVLAFGINGMQLNMAESRKSGICSRRSIIYWLRWHLQVAEKVSCLMSMPMMSSSTSGFSLRSGIRDGSTRYSLQAKLYSAMSTWSMLSCPCDIICRPCSIEGCNASASEVASAV